jgi:ribosomal protein L22
MAKRIKEKAAKRAEQRDMRPRAVARYVRISSRKVRIVIDLIRGKQVSEALAILKFTPKSASPVVEKLLKSAIANAEYKGLNKDDLYVAEVYADQGPTLKRMMPRAKGSGAMILKRSSHITVVLDEIKK